MRFITSTLTLGLLAALPLATPQAASSCNSSIERTAPDSRYTIDSANGTVFDKDTGLTWMRCLLGKAPSGNSCTGSATGLSWKGALQKAATINAGGGYAGKTDWRLPNAKELGSLLERRCTSPAVNENVFPNMPSSDLVWSSTPNHFSTKQANSTYAWSMHLFDGNDYRKPKDNPYRVLLVSDGN